MMPFENISIPFREPKPRNNGLTMVLDKNLGIRGTEDIVETAGNTIDIFKFGWGTSRICPRKILKQKIEILSSHDIIVHPGGTFLEVAFSQKKMDYYLKEAKELGFTGIEISDGIVVMPHSVKLESIKQAKDLGFMVFSEIGRKFELEDSQYPLDFRIQEARQELEVGADKIIVEARESGATGIFDKNHEVIQGVVEQFISNVGLENIIFEAPLPKQQEWLISNLGNSVNIGNVAVNDCINLETLRCGLRAGTLKEYHINRISVFIENGVGGAILAASRDNVIIVVDALRASSTIVTALANGAKCVRPVTEAHECCDEMSAGERGGSQIPGLDYDNSPLAFKSGVAKGKSLSLTTTNGTECIRAASKNNSVVLIGSLLNAKAIARKAYEIAARTKKDITIAMAGRNNLFAPEDLIAASEIAGHLPNCTLKGYIKPIISKDPTRDFLQSDSGKNLASLGKEQDVIFCSQKDIYNIVPIYKDNILVLSS